jgi:copper chaperone
MTTITYPVKGMSCQHCVNAVTSQLTGLAAVSGVTIDLVPDGTSLVTITSDGPLADAGDILHCPGGFLSAASGQKPAV